MANDLKSSSSVDPGAALNATRKAEENSGWLKVGTIAAASAVLGGLAAAWFYRKTLTQLREAENEISDSESRSIENGTGEDF
jgi:hypothetical protein